MRISVPSGDADIEIGNIYIPLGVIFRNISQGDNQIILNYLYDYCRYDLAIDMVFLLRTK